MTASPAPFHVACSRGLMRVRSGDLTVASFMRRVFLPGGAFYPGMDMTADTPAALRDWLSTVGGELLPQGFTAAGGSVRLDDDGFLVQGDTPGAFLSLFDASTWRTTCLESIHRGPGPQTLRVTVGHDGVLHPPRRAEHRRWAFVDLTFGQTLHAALTGDAPLDALRHEVIVLLDTGAALTPLLSFGEGRALPRPEGDHTLWVGGRSGWTALDIHADFTGVRVRSSSDGPRC